MEYRQMPVQDAYRHLSGWQIMRLGMLRATRRPEYAELTEQEQARLAFFKWRYQTRGV